jgi:hypothetical protein
VARISSRKRESAPVTQQFGSYAIRFSVVVVQQTFRHP